MTWGTLETLAIWGVVIVGGAVLIAIGVVAVLAIFSFAKGLVEALKK